MSLTRQFFREIMPLFRMLEQPFGRTPSLYGGRNWNRFDPFGDIDVRPAIDVTEQGDKYVLDAELPGVGKDNINVRVGDGGRSITIEGTVSEKNPPRRTEQISDSEDTTKGGRLLISPLLSLAESDDATAVAHSDQPTQLSVEREFTHNVRFTRTVWLPRPVDSQDVSAKLENGVLRISAKKAEDEGTTTIPIQ
jgi:HSP20 family molecular chaperone IbpA